MSFKDKVALLVSVLAFCVSALSLYMTQFRASYLAEAMVLESDALGGALLYQVAVMNQGTHRVVITHAHVEQRKSGNVLYARNPFQKVTLQPKLPAVVEPKDVLLLTFSGPLDLQSLYDRGGSPDTGGHEEFNGQATRKISFLATITAMDFLGRPYVATLGVGDYHLIPSAVATGTSPMPARATFKLQ